MDSNDIYKYYSVTIGYTETAAAESWCLWWNLHNLWPLSIISLASIQSQIPAADFPRAHTHAHSIPTCQCSVLQDTVITVYCSFNNTYPLCFYSHYWCIHSRSEVWWKHTHTHTHTCTLSGHSVMCALFPHLPHVTCVDFSLMKKQPWGMEMERCIILSSVDFTDCCVSEICHSFPSLTKLPPHQVYQLFIQRTYSMAEQLIIFVSKSWFKRECFFNH